MIETKYTEISKKLEERISAFPELDKLPSIRILAEEFKVSSRTMGKASKMLVSKGLIIPGPRGCQINRHKHIRRKTSVVGICVSDNNFKISPDPLCESLKLLIRQDGMEPLIMNVSDPNQFKNIDFWSSNWVDGYIFIYSSINKELAYKLKQHGVPFVLANRLPDEFGAHWVDFDNVGGLRKAAEYLYGKGLRRIAVDFLPFQMPTYQEYMVNAWKKIATDMKIFRPEYLLSRPGLSDDYIVEQAKYFLNLPKIPEGIILWDRSASIFESEFRKKGIFYPENIKFIEHNSGLPIANNNRYPYCSISYLLLAQKVWSLFKKVVKNSDRKIANVLLDVELIIS